MLKLLTVIFILQVFSITIAQKKAARDGPGNFLHEEDAYRVLNRHLVNMTESLCKDAMYKLRMASVIELTYRNSMGYELGIIASNLMDKFRHMIRIYRYYSNFKNFKNEDHAIPEIMNAYAIMQGDYNEMVAETVLYYQILDNRQKQDAEDLIEARALAKKHRISVGSILEMKKKGINLASYGLSRRSMKPKTELPEHVEKLPQENRTRQLLEEDGMSKNINTWTPKNKDKNKQEEEYKKKLRYTMWAEKWNGFNGETEGVNIADTIAKLGLANDSDFLLKELKGAV